MVLKKRCYRNKFVERVNVYRLYEFPFFSVGQVGKAMFSNLQCLIHSCLP